jgi:divalent metal cation (Fe/Co/Zn/Cd) transporter
VATNIIVTGVSLVRRSTGGLMDRALPADELARVHDILERFTAAGPVRFHALRTRRAGRRAFVSVHILVPGHWTVKRGHDLVERIEREAARGTRTRHRVHPSRAARGPRVLRRHRARPLRRARRS